MWDDESHRESNGVCIRCGCPLWDGYSISGSNFGGDHTHMTEYPKRDASGHLITPDGKPSLSAVFDEKIGKFIP